VSREAKVSLPAYFKTANEKSEGILSRYSDLLLVLGVVAIIALMVLPLPAVMIDLLVAANIAFGLMLILVAIYISSPLQFSVFPSVLLISTLFRLALSIATTRMILLEGEAGRIIDTFGELVAGGNLVVGLVVFLIITVVQFIVIAKGAERVAEVSARFSLDAMPGKQLSIDSDLRSGLLDKDEARSKRRELEQESKLHGSLDGAMKFVKGDAIAGIIIIIINLLGGLGVGVLQQGMDMSAAMVKYSILTIGDGMVAQIPALLGAMAAGLIVTRATDEEKDKHLGDSIQKQLTEKPRIMVVAGGICWLLALVPGFPGVVFLLIGIALFVLGLIRTPTVRKHIDELSKPAFEVVMQRKENVVPQIKSTALPEEKPAVPLLLQLPQHVAYEDSGSVLMQGLDDVLDDFQIRLGLPLPKINVYWHGRPHDGWCLLAYEVPIVDGDMSDIESIEALLDIVHRSLRRQAALFVGIQETSALLARASGDYPEVVKEVLRAVPMQRVAEIFRVLVEEEVPIRNLRGVLEAIADAGQREKDAFTLTEYARMSLKRQISHRYAPNGALRAIILVPELEEALRQAVRVTAGVPQLALNPEDAKKILDVLAAAVKRHEPMVVITTADLRRHIRKIIEQDHFDLPVLSYNELMSTLKLDVAESVTLPDVGKLAIA